MSTLGFIGLGNMGGPMAANLVRAGHSVTGFDLVPMALHAARTAGIAIAETPKDAVAGAEMVFTMLPAGAHVLSVMNDVLARAVAGTVFVDCSTIDVASARAAHAAAKTAGMLSMDAPVSGGVGGATAGTLTFMVGGKRSVFCFWSSRFWKRWEKRSFIVGKLDRVRRRKSVTTCCSGFR